MARYVLEIFLSSTSEDLRDHRRVVAEAIDSFGQLSVRMESFGAKPVAPLEVCRDEVRRCDALIVVVGHRYGWVPTEAEGGDGLKSITWWEVQWALEAKRPVYAFLADPNVAWTGPREQDGLLAASTEAEGVAVWRAVVGLKRFRAFLDNCTTRAYFRSVDQLATLVATSLVPFVVGHEVAQARALVEHESLPSPRPRPSAAHRPAPAFTLTSARPQVVIVGSDVVVFAKGVSADQRQDIVNASLLAQLVARNKVPGIHDLAGVLAWYDAYYEVAENIGWVVQDRALVEYTPEVELRKAVLELATSALGPSEALALVSSTLDRLANMSADSPTLTLLHRESQSANTARFQVLIAEPGEGGRLLTRILAFYLEADRTVTQALFFKSTRRHARLHYQVATVRMNSAVLEAIRQEVTAKLAGYVDDNVAWLDV